MAIEVLGTEKIVTLVAAIIDESGSMTGVAQETINGYNKFVADVQAEQAGKEAYVSTFLFDSGHTYTNGQAVARPTVRTIQDTVKLENAVPLNTSTYQPNGGTPLYDAIGMAISAIDKAVEAKGVNKVTLIIQTDGAENSSREYNHKAVTSMIKDRTDKGWQIIFMGADLANANSIGTNLGVLRANSMSYSKGNTVKAFAAMSNSTTAYRSSLNSSLENALSESDKADLAGDLNGFGGLGYGISNIGIAPVTTGTLSTGTPWNGSPIASSTVTEKKKSV
jgi:uncharacterized protein YegL